MNFCLNAGMDVLNHVKYLFLGFFTNRALYEHVLLEVANLIIDLVNQVVLRFIPINDKGASITAAEIRYRLHTGATQPNRRYLKCACLFVLGTSDYWFAGSHSTDWIVPRSISTGRFHACAYANTSLTYNVPSSPPRVERGVDPPIVSLPFAYAHQISTKKNDLPLCNLTFNTLTEDLIL